MGKRVYIWDGTTWVEQPVTEPDYAEMVAAEKELDRRKREEDERAAHPGKFL